MVQKCAFIAPRFHPKVNLFSLFCVLHSHGSEMKGRFPYFLSLSGNLGMLIYKKWVDNVFFSPFNRNTAACTPICLSLSISQRPLEIFSYKKPFPLTPLCLMHLGIEDLADCFLPPLFNWDLAYSESRLTFQFKCKIINISSWKVIFLKMLTWSCLCLILYYAHF